MGGLIISEEVITKIASVAALDVEGVAGMAQKSAKFGKKNGAARSVRVAVTEDEVKIDIYVKVRLGAKIREVSENIMRSVKDNVQSMTGRQVDIVNVYIEDIEMTVEEA